MAEGKGRDADFGICPSAGKGKGKGRNRREKERKSKKENNTGREALRLGCISKVSPVLLEGGAEGRGVRVDPPPPNRYL